MSRDNNRTVRYGTAVSSMCLTMDILNKENKVSAFTASLIIGNIFNYPKEEVFNDIIDCRKAMIELKR